MKPFLSKSQFIRGLQCHKSLWLFKNRPKLRAEPSEALQAVFNEGRKVGLLARELFPSGVEIVFEEGSLSQKTHETKDLIIKGVQTIYEATFSCDNVMAIVDILHKGTDGWELYEVKSSTSLKDVHLNDISIQCAVLQGCSLTLSRVCLVHINSDYIRKDGINVNELFELVDLTEQVASNQEYVREEIDKMRAMLAGGVCPDIDIGPYCTDPYKCEFIPYCWKHIPENSVFDLRGTGLDKFGYYKQGIIRFEDLELNKLNKAQRMQVEVELSGKEYIDREGIKAFLETLPYPLWFLDFETLYNEAIPPFDDTFPYCKIPFQYSLHYLEAENSDLMHYEFLGEALQDCREELAKRLSETVTNKGCILTYNMAFEKGIIADLARIYPQYSKKLMTIHGNIKDLMEPFKYRFYYTKEMKGSYSLKFVLPALLPNFSYEEMAIANGEDAVRAYKKLSSIEDEQQRNKIKKDLLEYCKLDTLAMVKLLEKLKATIGSSPT